MDKNKIEQNGIYWIDFFPSTGHEFQGRRPGVVIQSQKQIHKSNLITVIPLTSNLKNNIHDDIEVQPSEKNGLYSASILKVHALSSFDPLRFHKKIGELEEEHTSKIQDYLRIHFDL